VFRRGVGLLALLVVFATSTPAQANFLRRLFRQPGELDRLNRRLHGKILDFTFNHGTDNRQYSEALCEKRDLYVYLPPGYDPKLQYPLTIFLHGIGQDEKNFLEFAELFDRAMACGTLTPTIVACPDGSIKGRPALLNAGSFFVNSKAGRFEDYTMQDVWGFVHRTFPIRPEREAHLLVGGSMGGFGAYNLGIKYREQVAGVGAIFPPLNLRYLDCHGRYFGNFDPSCFGWRTRIQPFAPIGRYYGVITIRQRRLIDPLYGRSRDALDHIARENPVEMLETYDVKPGELQMFVAYVGRDEFNLDAQIESFLYIARGRGLTVSSAFMPEGHHTVAWAKKLTPNLIAWMATQLEGHGPIEIKSSPAPAKAP
jgi:S-formylglutathione hydrolase FrmB